MKTCSHCGYENETTASTCAKCAVQFEPPDVPPEGVLTDPDFSLVILATFRTVIDAGLLKTRLEAAGIEACIPEELTPQIFWNVVPSPLERVTVRVRAKDYEAAKEFLADGG